MPEKPPPSASNKVWHQSPVTLVVAFLIVGPFAIPLVWINRRFSVGIKIGLTVLMMALTGLLVHLSAGIVDDAMERFDELQRVLNTP